MTATTAKKPRRKATPKKETPAAVTELPGASKADTAAAKARQLLLEEQNNRIAACRAELDEVLKKHKCQMQVGMFVSPTGNRPLVDIVPVAPNQ